MFHPKGPTLFELAIQALSSTDRGYDLLAPKFDDTPFRTPDAVIARSLEALGGAPVDAGIDLCCGTGAATRLLRARCRSRALGLDRSAGMLEEARARSEDAPGDAELVFEQGDALALPAHLAGAFDVACSYGAFGHIEEEDEARFVDSVWRALVPGGRFVFVTSDPPSLASPVRWLAHGFNAAMRVRNALWKPEFVMYYLTFLVPRAQELLETRGFEVEVQRAFFPAPLGRLVNVLATRPR